MFMQSNTNLNAASQSSAIEINKVLKNTYMLLSMTLVFSTVTAVISMAMNLSHMVALVMMLGAFGVMFVVNKKAEQSSGVFWLFAFTGLMGASLGPMLNYYAAIDPSLIMQALGGTALIFFALSGYALTSKKDFSFMGGFLMVGLLVVIIAGIANLFFQVPAVSLALSAAIIMIMSGLILFDTGRIINGGERNYIRATLSLYLSVYNIFTSLLHLLGVFGSDD
ncbi:MAG: modulator of FtsH protease [Alteromonadaceae bacterium]|jgi:modulator of FtsH protease|tara:strand:+ start:472 stop:1140 length:669 start_codon:yes stop_codon:yes gene_type:complete